MDRTKKECILVEAAKAFARFGFKKASIDEIAKEAGVGKGTVYLAAESKEDLFYQVLHRELREWSAEVARSIDPRVRADRLLQRLLETAITYLEQRPLVCELFYGEVAKSMPAWADRFEDLRSLGRANVVEVLRLGVRQGVFRKDLDVETVGGLLQDFHLSAYFAERRKSTPDEIARRAAVGLDLVLNGLRDHHRALPA